MHELYILEYGNILFGLNNFLVHSNKYSVNNYLK
jgi:hypothetical protein